MRAGQYEVGRYLFCEVLTFDDQREIIANMSVL